MSASPATRVAAYRTRQRDLGLSDTSRKNRSRDNARYKTLHKSSRPFTGCDGEGAGTDDKGRQNYLLFRMGERELFNLGQRLETRELLDFICDHPGNEILVGFAFGYDVTMILRDLPEDRARRLFEPKDFGAKSPWVWYREFDIDYLHKQYFRVRRVRIERRDDGTEKRIPIKNSTRTIYETFGFFQKSFVKCIEQFEVGTPGDRARIAEDKSRRSSFTGIGERERDYCHKECLYLAELMEKLREYCNAAAIRPRTWNGAGKLAAALHKTHETPGTRDLTGVPQGVWDMANMAYYGGRFEITRTGMINQKVYEYDIRSAYPDAMRRLPCLLHGHWRPAGAWELRSYSGLYLSACAFKTARREQGFGQLGGLPIRTREGHLVWPLVGGGVYWSPEIESARRLGCQVVPKGGWIYEKNCNCSVFDWVEPLFDYRREIGSQGPGYPIKLGINSLYGKLAQRKGAGRYNNMIWAGLITALTRSKINDAIFLNPNGIVMCATDAVYSLDPLGDLDCGERLGQWEENVLDGLFIVQPGLYWSSNKRKCKSRGLSGSFFEKPGLTENFETTWEYYLAQLNSGIEAVLPGVNVPVPAFIGLKLALARNNADLAGRWVEDTREISFDYHNKRQSHKVCDGHLITSIKTASEGLYSLPHRDFLANGGHEPWENARMMLDEQPDYVDLGPPFED